MKTLLQYLTDNRETQQEFATRANMTQGNVAKLCGVTPKLSMDTALIIERVTRGSVAVEVWPQFAGLASRHIQSPVSSAPLSEAS